MREDEAGARIGIVMNGSPLFTGGANSGESEIRRWMFENDWVEAIIALPTDLFYNTGIQTYVWMLTNRKQDERRAKVQLIDASSERFWKSMRKSLGSKRREISKEGRDEIVKIYSNMLNGNSGWSEYSKIFDTTEFGYREVRVERPLRLSFQFSPERLQLLKTEKSFLKLSTAEQEILLNALIENLPASLFKNRVEFEAELNKALQNLSFKMPAPLKKAILSTLSQRDETADICMKANGTMEADSDLRDHELVPLKENWQEYIEREVKPFVSDAWVDESHIDPKDKEVGRIGYEINFNRYFYKYVAPRPVAEIHAELKDLEAEIAELLKGVGV